MTSMQKLARSVMRSRNIGAVRVSDAWTWLDDITSDETAAAVLAKLRGPRGNQDDFQSLQTKGFRAYRSGH